MAGWQWSELVCRGHNSVESTNRLLLGPFSSRLSPSELLLTPLPAARPRFFQAREPLFMGPADLLPVYERFVRQANFMAGDTGFEPVSPA